MKKNIFMALVLMMGAAGIQAVSDGVPTKNGVLSPPVGLGLAALQAPERVSFQLTGQPTAEDYYEDYYNNRNNSETRTRDLKWPRERDQLGFVLNQYPDAKKIPYIDTYNKWAILKPNGEILDPTQHLEEIQEAYIAGKLYLQFVSTRVKTAFHRVTD